MILTNTQVKDCLEVFSRAIMFLTIDMTKCIYQKKSNERIKIYTVFLLPKRFFIIKSILMGMKIHGAVFQKLTDQMIKDLQKKIT